MDDTSLEFDQHLKSLIASQLQEQQTRQAGGGNGAPPAPAGKEDLTLTVNGQTYTFEKKEDLEKAIAKTVEDYELRLKSVATPPAPATEPKNTTRGDDEPTFNTAAYLKKLEEGDVLGATRDALGHLLFDGKVQNPEEILRETVIETAQMRRQQAVSSFLAAHPNLADIKAQNIVEQARQRLNLPVTTEGLAAAYGYAIAQGALPPIQPQQTGQPEAYQPQGGYPPPAPVPAPYNPHVPPPVPSRSVGIPASVPQTETEWLAYAHQLDDTSLQNILRQAGKL